MTANALNPLPSFLRASAQDAANMQMRKAGRKAWNEDDYNLAADTLDRLVRSCYGKPSDHNQPDYCFIRFQHAETLEKQGRFSHVSRMPDIAREIEEAMA
jgi:hypothetical protein